MALKSLDFFMSSGAGTLDKAYLSVAVIVLHSPGDGTGCM